EGRRRSNAAGSRGAGGLVTHSSAASSRADAMLTISKPLSAAQVRTYHAEEFSNARHNYYTSDDQIRGQWHGQLARQWELLGDVREEHIQRLADGQHPITGDQLVRHQTARAYTNERGEPVKTMAHRAGW